MNLQGTSKIGYCKVKNGYCGHMKEFQQKFKWLFFLLLLAGTAMGQVVNKTKAGIRTGAERMDTYLPLLKGKRVGIFANQTTVVGPQQTHLVDTLLKRGVNVVKIFSPEHGFRGTADAGEKWATPLTPPPVLRSSPCMDPSGHPVRKTCRTWMC